MAYIPGTQFDDILVGFNESGDYISGFQGDDRLIGNNGNDDLRGNAGKDSLKGGGDNDFLIGGIGSDDLDGGRGNDTLIGFELGEKDATGVDILTGGEGSDRFFLALGNELYYDDISDNAQIKDFNLEEDKLILLGSASDYKIETFGGSNSFIYTQGQEDFIAVVEGVSNFNLNADYVQYL